MLYITMLTKDCREKLPVTLESLKPLGAKLLAGDMGSKDGTVDLIERASGTVVPLGHVEDYAAARNKLLAGVNGWVLQIDPGEKLFRGHVPIYEAARGEERAYRLGVVDGDVITKQTRLWPTSLGIKYINPAYETVTVDGKDLPAFVSGSSGRSPQEQIKIVEKWLEKSPAAPEPRYYHACSLLVLKNYKKFLTEANQYFFLETKPKMSAVMLRYYAAMVQCYVNKDYHSAVSHLLVCIEERPTMAEFWCLLGDVYFAIRDYGRAKAFYENGMILGGKRDKSDDWPVEISKYKEYPEKMLASCRSVSSSLYFPTSS